MDSARADDSHGAAICSTTIVQVRDYIVDIRTLLITALAACSATPPDVDLVDSGLDPTLTFLLHGDGETSSDVGARWLISASTPDVRTVAELAEMLEPLPNRSIVMGQGAGASLAYDLACARPDLVSHVVMLSGVASPIECSPGPRVSVLTVHGTVDAHTPYSTAAQTYERAKALTGCTESEQYVESPSIGVASNQLEALRCWNGPMRAEHWRVVGWDHNPSLSAEWGRAVTEWAAD